MAYSAPFEELPSGLSLAYLSAIFIIFLYLYHVNNALSGVPDAAACLAGKPWTEDEVRAAYKKSQESPLDISKHLPPKQDRRYIVVGGSGLVGGAIVLHLLVRGEDVDAIRIVDLRRPTPQISGGVKRSEQLNKISFEQADISNLDSVQKAFSAPWPASVSQRPLTVYHTAAIIRVSERLLDLLPLSTKINVDGTRHVLSAAKASGATCLIATSSGSISVRPPRFWLLPWRRFPDGYLQVMNDDDFDLDRPLHTFYANYPISKAMAERLVRDADDPATGFRTGAIRPASGVYGTSSDNTAGNYMKRRGGPTWIGHIITNFVYVENVSVAHLLFEQRLLEREAAVAAAAAAAAATAAKSNSPNSTSSTSSASSTTLPPDLGGRAFLITDPNPPIRFRDLYALITALSATPLRFRYVPPLPFFLLAHLLEAYAFLRHRLRLPPLPPLTGDAALLQPALWAISNAHLVYDDKEARRGVEEGGLGFRAPYRTMEALCRQVGAWNEECERGEGAGEGVVSSAEVAAGMSAGLGLGGT